MSSSKLIFTQIFLAVLLLPLAFVVGCAQENEHHDQVGKMSFGDEICIGRFAQTIEDFVFARLQRGEVIDFWNCMNKAVHLYKSYVRGKENHRYSKEEIRSFIQRFFVRDRVINDVMLVELMRIKVLLLGGTVDYVLRSELESVSSLFNELQQITLNLHPHLAVLSLPYQDQKSLVRVEGVNLGLQVLRDELRKFGHIIARNRVSYEVEHLTTLLKEMDEFLTWEDPLERFNKIRLYVPLIAELKGALFNSSAKEIEKDEWQALMDTTSEAYSLFVRFTNHVKGQDFTRGESFRQITVIGSTIERILYRGLDHYPDQTVPHERVERIVDRWHETGQMPALFGPEEVKHLWHLLVDKVLAEGLPPQGGLIPSHLDNLFREFNFWVGAQKQVNHSFTGLLRKGSCAQPFLLNPIDLPSIEELKRITDCAPWNFRISDEPRLFLDYDIYNNNPHHHSLSMANWQRAVVRLIIKTYARDRLRREKRVGLTEKELATGYRDLKPILVGLDLVAKDDNRYYQDIFLQSRFFMPQSNGNTIIEFAEGVEYFYGVLSGATVGERIVEELKTVCPFEEKMGDRFGGPFIDRTCVHDKLYENFSRWYFHLPEFVVYQKGLSREKWDEIILSAEKAIGFKDKEKPYFSQERMVKFSVFLQYIETFFVRYDDNQNRWLSLNELSDALPTYSHVLSKMANPPRLEKLRSPIADEEGAFAWIFRQEGRVDLDEAPGVRREKNKWMAEPQGRFLEIDRGGLIKTVGSMSELLN